MRDDFKAIRIFDYTIKKSSNMGNNKAYFEMILRKELSLLLKKGKASRTLLRLKK